MRAVETRVAHFLDIARAAKSLPGMSLALAVGADGRLVLAKGFGEARAHTPASPQTVYQIGSITKQFTAALVLRAIRSGAVSVRTGRPLSLATPVHELFEGVGHWTRDDRTAITLHDLLTMTSNLPNFTRRLPAGADPWGSVAADQLLARFKQYRPSGWPNTFEYNNTGYFLLSELLEELRWPAADSARSYVRQMRDMLGELGMKDSGFAHDASDGLERAAPNYDGPPVFTKPDWLKGSGDMAASAADLFAWDKALIEGRVLAPADREKMLEPAARVDPHTWYAMGWFVTEKDGWQILRHSGSVPGFTAMNLIARPAGRGDWSRWVSVSILLNGEEIEDLELLAEDVARCIAGEAC
jgi:CubicO group peptidase (beta-lactamase class C family)